MFTKLRTKTYYAFKFSPFFYKIYRSLKKNYHGLVDPHVDLVVEGYPRSANTFAYYLIKNVRNLSIAHHTHSLANVKLGLKYKIPSVVLLRDPYDAISSSILQKVGLERIKESDIDKEIEKQLYYYKKFYSYISKKKNKMLLMKFETVIKDPGKFIQEVHNFLLKKDRGLLIPVGTNIDYDNLSSQVRKMIENKETLKGIDEKSWSAPKNRKEYEQKREKLKQKIELLDNNRVFVIYNTLKDKAL